MSKYVGKWRLFSFMFLFVIFAGIFSAVQITFAVNNDGKISGTVLDSDGDPVIGASVTITATNLIRDPVETRTNTKGKYRFKNLELGTYDVSLSEDCYANAGLQTQQVELTAGDPRAKVNFDLTELTNQANLAGMVKDKVTKAPIVNATIRIKKPKNEATETTTDNKGYFRFGECLTAGTKYLIEAEKAGYNTRKKRVTAVEGENKCIFKLTAASTTTTTTVPVTTTTVTTTSSSTTTISSTTTTTTSGTTTTTIEGECPPCVGSSHGITFSTSCNSFSFSISGESGPRAENLTYKRNAKGQITYACGTVTYVNTANTYCIEIDVDWGFFCINNTSGIARWVGVGTTTSTLSPGTTTTVPGSTTTTTTVPGGTTTTTTSSTTTTTTTPQHCFIGSWNISGTVKTCVPDFGCDNVPFTDCFQANSDGSIEWQQFLGDPTTIGGTWTSTGATSVQVGLDEHDLELYMESVIEDLTGVSCNVSISDAYASFTITNCNNLTGTLYFAGTVYCQGQTIPFTATVNVTSGSKTTSCTLFSTSSDTLNSMLGSILKQVFSVRE